MRLKHAEENTEKIYLFYRWQIPPKTLKPKLDQQLLNLETSRALYIRKKQKQKQNIIS